MTHSGGAGQTAAEALQTVATNGLRALGTFGVYDGPPLRASPPYAIVAIGPETDWGHKSGAGREIRLSVTLKDEGESPARLRRLLGQVEHAFADLQAPAGWSIVTLRHLRSRIVADARGSAERAWAGVAEFRARLLAQQD